MHQYGVCIIENVLNTEQATAYRNAIINNVVSLNKAIDLNKIETTWTRPNLPPQMVEGQFKSHIANLEPVWSVRRHPNVHKVFSTLYSDAEFAKVRGYIPDKFTIASDGINLRPAYVPPYTSDADLSDYSKDWAHIDSTNRNDPFHCIQGQVVLNQSTAAFRCSPGSHLVFNQVLDLYKVSATDLTNWCKFDVKSPADIDKIKQVESLVNKSGGVYQIPIYANAGSMIVWLSSVIHSAKFFSKDSQKRIQPELLKATFGKPLKPTKKDDPFLGWRCVVYVCYRPYDETAHEEFARKQIIRNNQSTNHYGLLVSDKGDMDRYHPAIQVILKDPTKVYEITKYRPPEDICII